MLGHSRRVSFPGMCMFLGLLGSACLLLLYVTIETVVSNFALFLCSFTEFPLT